MWRFVDVMVSLFCVDQSCGQTQTLIDKQPKQILGFHYYVLS